jgi:hypothetical protein
MLLAALAKVTFALSTVMLWLLGRVSLGPTALSGVDFCLGLLFCLAFRATPPLARTEPRSAPGWRSRVERAP